MTNKTAYILIFSFFPFLLFGQATNASRKEVNAYDNAVILVNSGKYKEALVELNTLVRNNKKFVEASWTLAELHDKMRNDSKRISTLQSVAKPKMPRYYNSVMRLAAAYAETCNYEEAIKTYELIPASESTFHRIAQREIQNCRNAIELRGNQVPFHIKNMGSNINTKFDDYWPSITADEGWFSTTIKMGKLEGESDFGKGVHEDIFISKKADGGMWEPVKNAGPALNTMGNEGAQSFSLDSRYLFFVACDRRTGLGGCDIYYSMKNGDIWSEPINPGEPLNTKNWESSPNFSAAGDELFFSSNRPGGKGKKDIWKCKVQIGDEGRLIFSNPVNLGSTINTIEDEFSPFIHPDNKTLYFSSTGHPGLGGHDVYVARRTSKNGAWSIPMNLGYPINTHKDEMGFVVNATGDKAYFASDGIQKNGRGKDIYELTLYDEIRPEPVKYFKGKIYDYDNKNPIQAHVELYRLEDNVVVYESVSDAKTGDFLASLPADKEYGLNVNKKGYLFHSGHLAENDSVEIKISQKIDLPKIEVGRLVILKNVFFDFDLYSLKKESRAELDRLTVFLQENPRIHLELAGHTDSKGSHDYNITLSRNRAKAVYDYLVKKGINPGRLTYVGYGPDRPIATNDTDAGRALNRRTEAIITAR